MSSAKEFDVRSLKPIKRHEKLLKQFKELPVGESFIFINDHDPKPLYYEFRSIYGDVVGWNYLKTEPEEWKVKVTREEQSKGRDFDEVSTLIDLRKTDQKDWKYTVFHRYGMMVRGDTMELIAEEDPEPIKEIFEQKFEGEHSWEYKKKEQGEYVIHITKEADNDIDTTDMSVVNKMDVRPHPPAKRHEMIFEAFDALNPGEAFVFINDHDPKPLYYQMEAESEESFEWEYLETMPEEWKIKIMKLEE
jgi:uncharacterized protein (DUF2249 family)